MNFVATDSSVLGRVLLASMIGIGLFAGCGTSKAPKSHSQMIEDAKRISDPAGRYQKLRELMYAIHDDEDEENARAAIGFAYQAAKNIESPLTRARAYNGVAYGYGFLGDKDRAMEIVAKAEKTIEAGESGLDKIKITCKMAEIHYRFAPAPEDAQDYFDRAEKLSREQKLVEQRVRGLCEVAFYLKRLKRDEATEAMLLKARSEVGDLEAGNVDREAVDAGIAMTDGYYHVGFGKRGSEYVAEIEQAIAKLPEPLAKAHTLKNLAMVLLNRRQKALAKPLLESAKKAAEKVKDKGLREAVEKQIRLGLRKV